tara:strand:+ start:1892 stop:2095 length:204 start_codon:yes stop_codon:yes gene_type:complete
VSKIFCKTLCRTTQKETTRVFYRNYWGENLCVDYNDDADEVKSIVYLWKELNDPPYSPPHVLSTSAG